MRLAAGSHSPRRAGRIRALPQRRRVSDSATCAVFATQARATRTQLGLCSARRANAAGSNARAPPRHAASRSARAALCGARRGERTRRRVWRGVCSAAPVRRVALSHWRRVARVRMVVPAALPCAASHAQRATSASEVSWGLQRLFSDKSNATQHAAVLEAAQGLSVHVATQGYE